MINFFKQLGEKISQLSQEQSLQNNVKDAFGENESANNRHAFFKELCDIPELTSLLSYVSFDEKNELFLNQESIGFVIETGPLAGAGDHAQAQIQNFLNTVMPCESAMQVSLYADPCVDSILERYTNARKVAKPIYKKLVAKRAEFLKKMTYVSKLSPYTIRNYRVFWSFTVDKEDAKILEILSLRDQFLSTLSMIGLEPVILRPNDLLRLVDDLIHPTFQKTKERELVWNPYQNLSEQISLLPFQTRVTEKAILCRGGEEGDGNIEMGIRTFSVAGQPNEWCLNMMDELLGNETNDRLQIGCPFWINYGFYIPKQSGMKAKIISKENFVNKQANSPIVKLFPQLKRESAELSYVMGCLSTGDRIVQTQMTVSLFARSQDLDQISNTLKNIFVLSRWRLRENDNFHLPVLLSSLPMSWSTMQVKALAAHNLTKTTLTTEVSNNIPCIAEWKGVPTPCFLLSGRKGQLLSWSPFDSNTNYNTIVVGTSGSGKSMAMQELTLSFLGMGARVVVFDLGRSFEKTCRLSKEQYIRFDVNSNMCINPFSFVEEIDSDEQREQLESIVITMEQMAERREGLDDIQSSFLQKAIYATFKEKGRKTTVTDVANTLLSQIDTRAQDVGMLLFNYTEKGSYGKWFNGTANINLKDQLVVIELEDLKEKPALQNVVLQSFLANLTQHLYLGNRKQKTIFIVDEAAQLLENSHFSKAAQDMARRVRKYEACLVTGTQSFADFYANEYSTKILDNAAWVLMLNQEPTSIEQLGKTGKMSMTPYKENMMKSVKTVSGSYSEIMVSSSSGYTVGRLVLDPFSLMLFSTRAEDFSLIEELISEGLSVEDAVEKALVIKEQQSTHTIKQLKMAS